MPRSTASEIEIHLNAQPERGEVLRKDARVDAFLKLLKKIGARPLWLGAQQHDYAVGLASHLPQLVAVALASFLYDRLDENGLADYGCWARVARYVAAGG